MSWKTFKGRRGGYGAPQVPDQLLYATGIQEGWYSQPPAGNDSLIDIITGLSLTSGLKVCLDAGDGDSYTTGQSWLDTSGNGYDFFRGATSSETTDDPTFNGAPGDLSIAEFWAFDGGDKFRYDTTNETWMQNLHKDNATFTVLMGIYPATVSGSNGIFGTAPSSANVGCRLYLSSDNLRFIVSGDSGSTVIDDSSSGGATALTWNILGMSLNESAGATGRVFFVNGAESAGSATYTSPSTSSAGFAMEIGSVGNSTARIQSGGRIGFFAMWEGVALTGPQMQSIMDEIGPRYGL